MKNNKKRGFTIVELVIVIAVIGILAAILVPTFTGLVEKARQNTDQQIVYHLNTAIKTIEAERLKEDKTAKCDTMHETVLALDENGYGITKLTPTSNGDIIWDSTTNRFALIGKKDSDSEESVLYYDETVSAPDLDNKVNLWKVYNTASDIDNTYSAYLADNNATTLGKNISVGFDAGNNTKLTAVNYIRTTGEAQTVTVRTNSYETALTINAEKDTVKHYDVCGSVDVIAAARTSYHEYGTVAFLEIAKGRVVLEAESKVDEIHIDTKVTSVSDSGEKTKVANIFDEVVVNVASGVELPEFSRDAVAVDSIGVNGTLVVEVEKGNNQSDYIYLYQQGIVEQIKVTTGTSTNIEDTSAKVIDSDAIDGDEATGNTGSIACDIANNFNGKKAGEYTLGENDVNDDGSLIDTTKAVDTGLGEDKLEEKKSEVVEQYLFTLPETKPIGVGETWEIENGANYNITSTDETIVSVVNGVLTANKTGEATISANGKSCIVTVTMFHDGTGAENNPYQVANAEQFSHIHDIIDDNNWLKDVSFKLVADIDYNGKVFPSASKDRIKWDSVILDGNNHKISNADATPTGSEYPECLLGNYYYGLSNIVKNLTIENCTFNGLFYATWNGSSADKLVISNVTIKNSTAYDGAFVDWSAGSRVEISDSSVINTTVSYRGWAGSVGGFIGNGQNVLIEDSKMINSSVVGATGGACGGFISQSGTNVEINNCLFDANSVVKNISSGSVYAIGGTVTSSEGNEFYGMLISPSKSQASISGLDSSSYSVDSLWIKYNTDIVAENFTFNSDGTITYNGTKSYDKFVVTQRIWTSNCTAGAYTGVGGFQKDFDRHEFTSNSLTYTKLTKIQQYAPNATVAAMLRSTTTDSNYIKEEYGSEIITGGTVYIDANGVLTTKLLDAEGNGQFVGGTLLTDTATSYNVTVIVTAISGESEVGTVSFTYSVPLELE